MRRPTRAELIEGAENVAREAITGILTGLAFAASFDHTRYTITVNGQPGWVGTATAVGLELLAVWSVLDIRRRRRRGLPVVWPAICLVAGIGASVACNLYTRGPGVWGALAAIAPAVICGLVLVGKAVPAGRVPTDLGAEDRPDVEDEPVRDVWLPAADVPAPADLDPVAQLAVIAVVPHRDAPYPTEDEPRGPYSDLDEAQVGWATGVAMRYASEGRRLTRDQLRDEMSVATGTATVLHRYLRSKGLVPA